MGKESAVFILTLSLLGQNLANQYLNVPHPLRGTDDVIHTKLKQSCKFIYSLQLF